MKGLFVKDLKLMMLQKDFLLLILAIVIGMMIFTDDVIFPLGFLSFIVSLFTVSTISYDDFDNGNAFLFTLPITRNHYVSEKYFLGLLLGCMAWVLATVLGIITTVLKDTLPITDLVQNSLMILPIMIVVQAIMLPFQLKFGGDKGRIAMIGAFGGLAVITLVIVKGAEAIFNIDLVSLLDNMPTVSMGVLIAIAIIIALLMLLVSMKISLSIMNKKNFKRSNYMDFTILAVVLLLCGGIPLRNKIYKERKKKKRIKRKVYKVGDFMDSILCVLALIVFAYWFLSNITKNNCCCEENINENTKSCPKCGSTDIVRITDNLTAMPAEIIFTQALIRYLGKSL